VSYDGKVAGTAAAKAARATPAPALPQEAVAAEERRVFGALRTDGDGPFPIEIKRHIRDVMWELGYVKSERKLLAARDAIGKIREEELPRLRLRSASRRWNVGWMDALDASSMLDACEATVRSGLLRRESRGPFYREDYPYVDNENWLCKVLLARTGDEWHSRTEPYALPYLQPERVREPFFEADY
jgi:succinate dehydrogenase / fumarate reductase flavoprotein subunit